MVQNPTTSLADDVAFTKRVVASQQGKVLLVGHSYGGVVVTEAGTDPKVAGLVYVAAFAHDEGEAVQSLISNPAPGAPVPPILPPQDGFLLLDQTKFAFSFAADVDELDRQLHGWITSTVGRQRTCGRDHRASLEGQAELVSGGSR